MTELSSYSISVRLCRITTEEAYVSVPVTEALMQSEPDADGAFHLDDAKVVAEAVAMGSRLSSWQVEEQDIQPHPIQKAPPHVVPIARSS
jgi:hypothetical protein